MIKTFRTYLREAEEQQQQQVVPLGLCYQWAYDQIKNGKKGVKLVHGKVKHPWTGKEYHHAWIEDGNKVKDWQTMEAGSSKHAGKGWPKKEFYKLYQPTETTEYDNTSAMRNATKHRHYGPWSKPRAS
jgi:hypothetical protein